MGVRSLDLHAYRRVVVLTGAGISVASGLRPYRGPGGIWEEGEVARFSSARGLREDPPGALHFYSLLRDAVRQARPNAAHTALARAEALLPPGGSLVVLTQNVDGLQGAAGSSTVVELHGNIRRSRCASCSAPPFPDDDPLSVQRRCEACGGQLRPDIVLFGELLSANAEYAAKRALRECDLFVAVGTSGAVSPASNFVRSAKYEGARTVLANLEPMQPANPAFDEEWIGKAEEILPVAIGEDCGP